MVIVAGKLYVEPAARQAYVESCREVIVLARAAPGCQDFHITADPLEPGRVNVFEQWRSRADVEAFRGSGPSSDQSAAILDAAVYQHEVSASEHL
jgi:quinol monooxygenase YgiN